MSYADFGEDCSTDIGECVCYLCGDCLEVYSECDCWISFCDDCDEYYDDCECLVDMDEF